MAHKLKIQTTTQRANLSTMLHHANLEQCLIRSGRTVWLIWTAMNFKLARAWLLPSQQAVGNG
eukprot:2509442-Amphidinium_carterae.1